MKSLLKFITCGSVDDGKSTLIGHILYDAKLLYADQEKALELDSKVGSRGGKIDYSLLLDGLLAEREQGITIDVAYRYFTTDNRSFIVADTPGHEEYTRNMAVGASFADLSVILIDAKQGVLLQTKRHTRICKLMGIRYFVFVVNKMDLIGYDQAGFEKIKAQIEILAKELELEHVTVIPVSATEGDNVTEKSENISWYQGEALLPYLETVDISDTAEENGFYMPVQRVCRPNHTFRGFQGQIESGTVKVGDTITTLPSRETARVKCIYVGSRETDEATKGQPVTIQLDREVDVSRGCVLSMDSDAKLTASVTASILWMDDTVLENGRNFLAKLGTKRIPCVVTKILNAVDVNTGENKKTDHLGKNGLAQCEITFADSIVAAEFEKHKTLGELILIDRITNMTSACGIVTKIHSEGQETSVVTGNLRASLKGQTPVVVEFDTKRKGVTLELVQQVEKELCAMGRHTYLYQPKPGEAYERTAEHLVEAGIIVLLVLDGESKASDGLRTKPFYYGGWQEKAGTALKDAVAFVKEKSSYSSYISRDRDFI